MPTTATTIYTNAGLQPAVNPEDSRMLCVRLDPSTVYQAGSLIGEVTATPGTFGDYASGNADGSQNPRMILKYACTTDANGVITYGANVSEYGATSQAAPAYYRGTFRTDDLPQTGVGAINSAALTNSPQWKLVQGTVVLGLVNIG